MKIQVIRSLEQVDVAQLSELLRQLDPTGKLPSEEAISACVSDKATFLLVAQNEEDGGGTWCGMVTAIICTTIKNKKAIIEDFVVREDFRRQGVGKLLMKAALDCAKEQGAEYCDLTSRPERVAANVFYQNYGFSKRGTNCYRINLN